MSPIFTRQSQGTLIRSSIQFFPLSVYGAITLYSGAFQNTSTSLSKNKLIPYTTSATDFSARSVWTISLSLAAIKEITIVFFSSPY